MSALPTSRTLGVLGLLVTCLALVGCGSSPTTAPGPLRIDAVDYDRAFAAAVDVAHDHDMPALLRDARAGLIETETTVCGGLLEPWRRDETFDHRFSQTVNFERRHTRFEFAPANEGAAAVQETNVLRGPDVSGVRAQMVDLTRIDGPLELQVRVFIERANRPGERRGLWSRRVASRPVVPDEPDGIWWTPVTRDLALEHVLMEEIATRLRSAGVDGAISTAEN